MIQFAGGTPGARLVTTWLLLGVVLARAHGDLPSHKHIGLPGQLSATSTSDDAYVPQFAHAIFNVSIAENSAGKTFAVQPPSEDRLGIAVNAELDVRFRIVGGDKEKIFKAEERLVGDFAFLAIRLRTSNVVLNREKVDEYRLEVRATITRRDSKNSVAIDADTNVIVTVLDRNDLSPLFYPNEYTVSVAEDMPLHKSIIQVMAEDADLGINGEIYYSFLDETEYFAVHPTSGVITLTRPLKFTDRSIHDLVVVATDRGSTNHNRLSQASKARVHVKVKQVSIPYSSFLIILCI